MAAWWRSGIVISVRFWQIKIESFTISSKSIKKINTLCKVSLTQREDPEAVCQRTNSLVTDYSRVVFRTMVAQLQGILPVKCSLFHIEAKPLVSICKRSCNLKTFVAPVNFWFESKWIAVDIHYTSRSQPVPVKLEKKLHQQVTACPGKAGKNDFCCIGTNFRFESNCITVGVH